MKSGFSLAELLLTLTIIGVIASEVIPVVVNDVQEAELRIAWKKTFSTFTQATMFILQDNTNNLEYAFDLPSKTNATASENYKNVFASKLHILKNCKGTAAWGGTGTGASAEGCWHVGEGSWYFLHGGTLGSRDHPGLVLSDGTLVRFYMDRSNCTYAVGTYTRCGLISFDVNGFKKPNTIGKDIFTVSVTKNGIVPYGSKGYFIPSESCLPGNTMSTNEGHGCSMKYLYQ
jgi:prepilin-type N-terminal cleavage/methylation domain-containing protein